MILAAAANMSCAMVLGALIGSERQLRQRMAGLRDKHVGAALRLIRDRPADSWTQESLALKVGQSRSVFAERFADFVGIPAIQYLARWRLTLASQLLDNRSLSVAQAGAEVGYESEAAFNRAFKKRVGTAPGTWRKERRELQRLA